MRGTGDRSQGVEGRAITVAGLAVMVSQDDRR
jgi:hypothetical protein